MTASGARLLPLREVDHRLGGNEAAAQLRKLAEPLKSSGYGRYLLEVMADEGR